MNEWTKIKVGDMSESCLGKMLDKKKNRGELQLYLSNKSVRWGGFDLGNLSRMRFEDHEEERYGLVSGDLIVCEGGEPGRCAIWQGQIPNMKIQKALHRVRVMPNFNNRFLYYRFLLAGKNGELDNYFIGSTIKHLTGVNLKKIEFSFPAFEMQNNISKILSDLDSKIELNNKINAELETMAKLIYDYWFVQFDFPNAKGKPYKTSGGKMVWSEELKREIPEGWNIISLGDNIDIHRGISYKSSDINGSGIPMINLNSFSLDGRYKASGIKRYSGNYSDKNILSAGDLLVAATDVTRNADIIGKAFLVPDYYTKDLVYSMDIAKIRPKNGMTAPYLMMLFNSNHYHNYIKWYASGTLVLHLNMDGLKWYKTVMPSLELLNKFDILFKPIASRINITQKQNEELTALRDWLLPMLMNGQVRIKDVDVSRGVTQPVEEAAFRPVNPYFYQTQVIAAIVNASKKNHIKHGEMTLAKYSYLLDKIYKVPTLFNYDRWHLGPYPKEMKKVVNNKKFFKIQNNEVSVVPQKKEYDFEFQQQVEDAVTELASIFNQYKGKERSHQTELLATVCKVVEDIQSTDLKAVRESMKKWPIKLKGENFKNKAEKFGEEETEVIMSFMIKKGWDKLLTATMAA